MIFVSSPHIKEHLWKATTILPKSVKPLPVVGVSFSPAIATDCVG